MSGDPEQEYFSDGITEEIITSPIKDRQTFCHCQELIVYLQRKARKGPSR